MSQNSTLVTANSRDTCSKQQSNLAMKIPTINEKTLAKLEVLLQGMLASKLRCRTNKAMHRSFDYHIGKCHHLPNHLLGPEAIIATSLSAFPNRLSISDLMLCHSTRLMDVTFYDTFQKFLSCIIYWFYGWMTDDLCSWFVSLHTCGSIHRPAAMCRQAIPCSNSAGIHHWMQHLVAVLAIALQTQKLIPSMTDP